MDMIQKLIIALDTPEKLDRKEIMSIHDLPEFTENRSFSIEERNKSFVYADTSELAENLKCPCCIDRMHKALKRLTDRIDKTDRTTYIQDGLKQVNDVCDKLINSIDEIIKSLKM